jgi:nucleotide-binding universal stress UspA family protein
MNETGTSETRGVVVVGVDGSAGAKAALRRGIAEARLRNARLRAVHVFTLAEARRWRPSPFAAHPLSSMPQQEEGSHEPAARTA